MSTASSSSGSSQRDSQWLQLDVCREFLTKKCNKSDCNSAHPLAHVEIFDGKVMACYDSFKGRCKRVTPPCKFYHPTPPLMEVLVARGRNHLAMKNLIFHEENLKKIEIGNKRSAEIAEIPYEMMYFKRPAIAPLTIPFVPFLPQPIFTQPQIPIVPSDRELID
jgi:muscleblind protein